MAIDMPKSLIVKLKLPIAMSSQPVPPATPLPTKLTDCFSQSQLALALSIQKSKPEGTPTSEYCQQLSRHIQTGLPTPKEDLRYIDSAEFWKEQYTKIHHEKKALEERIQALENASSVRRATQTGNDTQDDATFAAKVLLEILNTGTGGDQSSRKRPAASQTVEGFEDDRLAWDVLGESHVVKLSNYVFQLGRQRGQLDKIVQETNDLDHINVLANQAIQMLVTIDNVLSECCLPLRSMKTSTEDTGCLLFFQQVMNQTETCFLTCFSALNELCHTIPGREKKHQLIYRMIMFIEKSLGLLHTMSEMQIENERAQSRSLRTKRAKVDGAEYAVSKYLAAMLSSILTRLEWKAGQPSHSELLEGILFCTLEHAGRLVSEAVFEEHVALSDSPGNITKDSGASDNGRLKLESRYVVQVLHAALGGATKKDIVAKVVVADKGNHRGSKCSLRLSGNILARARSLLQSTLLKSALGGDDLESLSPPTPPAKDFDFVVENTGTGEKYGPEWLVGAVWALVGWDLVT